jgi:hypothetical protein
VKRVIPLNQVLIMHWKICLKENPI